jgi:hypothetical protein
MTSQGHEAAAEPAPQERRSTPSSSGPPEQSAGGEEPQPDGVEPKAGCPRTDPRHGRTPYRTGR